ncbi:NADH-quinone oxidoreductase subunit K [Infirmifilum lucidum]|uniref:NADH-quinone oxidoreductase subunit K n=1 Tax=Infirmifilum lucidum TaxID=2776706 RepID=A0A7L9FKC7_9CREN|nr:NADH-quinone oxidoreductase subunit K [Infirmifilum lucidum]QOJ79326.1 NADH-quinone oxidoreductase subunit K [Infirmifilum lucidum]
MSGEIIVVSTALTLVVAGLAAIAATRNMIKVVMGIQSMVLGSLLLFGLACRGSGVVAQDLFLLVATTAAASEALVMAIVLLVWERFKTIDPRRVSELRW